MRIFLQKSIGSALLMVVLVSGFLLAMFASYSTSLRSGLRSTMDIGGSLVRYDDALRAVSVGGAELDMPTEWVLEGMGEFMVFSGALTDINWVKPGTLTLTWSGGSAFCYSGLDGSILMSGCTRQTITLGILNNTGSLQLRTLGWWTRVIASPTYQVLSPHVRYTIYEPIGNLLLPITTLHTQY